MPRRTGLPTLTDERRKRKATRETEHGPQDETRRG